MSLKNISSVPVVLVLAGLFFIAVFGYFSKNNNTATTQNIIPSQDPALSVRIEKIAIEEENFTGQTIKIEGSSIALTEAQKYINEEVSSFRQIANTEVPERREKFGENSPPASYSIDINASYETALDTESVVVSVYSYTGGAHGSSIYKTFNSSLSTGQLILLQDLIKEDQQDAFASFIKNKLTNWKPDGNASPVFKEEVEKLSFKDLNKWSINEDSFIVYFNQYEIGPGALGSIPFLVPLSEIQMFLK